MNGFIWLKSVLFACVFFCSQLAIAQDMYFNPELSLNQEQVNVNQADAKTIALVLNGIGISRAEAIVAYRQENGRFTSVEDITLVKGVGELTMLNNENKIVFE